MFVLGLLFLPESLSWLLMKGPREDANASLRKLELYEDVELDLETMETTLEKEKGIRQQSSS